MSWTERLVNRARDLFLPHKGNAYVPHALQHRVLFGYGIFLVTLKALFLCAVLVLPASSLYSSAITPENIVSLTNKTREEFSLPKLKVNPLLVRAAQAKAENMMVEQYFQHVSPEGVTPWQWIKGAGYTYRYAGENLAAHFSQAEAVQEAWMLSPTHKANIVSKKYSEIGVAVVRGKYNGSDTTFVVEMFGAPKGTTVLAAADIEESPSTVSEAVQQVQIIPQERVLTMQVIAAPDTARVSIVTGDTLLPLEKTADGEWQGELNTADSAGTQHISVLTTNKKGEEVVSPAVVYVPNSTTQSTFAFGDEGNKSLRVFGYTISGLEDHVRQIYVAMIAILSLVLLLSVVVKFQIQKHTVTAHALFVIVLAGVMALV